MTWFLNHYECNECDGQWTDEWSCMVDCECPHCEARDITPHTSEDLTTVIEKTGSSYVVLWSPEAAEHTPEYCELGRFATKQQAIDFLSQD